MNVLAISASPRIGGNSDTLCDRFLQGAADAGHSTRKITLVQQDIHPCKACYGCGKTHACVQKDDMANILRALIDADVILLSTPTYFYSMDAQMKMMIDRCLPRFQEIVGKRFYLLATAADPEHDSIEPVLSGLRGFLACLPDAREEGVLYGTGAWEKGDVQRLPVMQMAYDAGKNLE